MLLITFVTPQLHERRLLLNNSNIMYQHIWEIVVYRAASQRLAASYCPSAASSTLASVQLERLWKEFQRDAPCESNNSTSYQGPFFEEVPHRSSSLSSATVNAGEPNRYSIKLLQRQKISRIQSGISNCNEFTDFFVCRLPNAIHKWNLHSHCNWLREADN